MVGIHFVWMIGLLVMLAVGAAIVVGVILLAAKGAQTFAGTMPPPRYSPDGKWWWDGRTWQPAPQPPTTSPTDPRPPAPT